MAAALAPEHPPVWRLGGFIRRRSGKLGLALGHLARSIALAPEAVEAQDLLSWCRQLAGDVEAAAAAAGAAHRQAPHRADLHAVYILALQPLMAASQPAILAETREWHRRFAAPLGEALPPPANEPDPERRLRIGYIAAQGFRTHTAGSLLMPLIEGHDPAAVELFCYSDVAAEREDWVTGRLRERAQHWRSCGGLGDGELAQQIRADRIDVLVDIHGHAPGSRLLALARRPAPVQVNGVPMSSFGLDAVGWAIGDDRLTPPGSEAWFHERLLRVPLAYCFRNLAPLPRPRPLRAAGPVVFGSLNQPGKISKAALAAWACILERVAGSRLILKGMAFADGHARDGFAERARRSGIPLDRLELRPWSPAVAEHLQTYDEIDVALDPFPYCGVTTTCEALSIGVPVVSLAADRVIGRYGASLLGAIGLEHLVAGTVERYIEIAVALAADRTKLDVLRTSLRERFPLSRICDGRAYAGSLEAAYRTMWRDWCRRQ